MKEIIIRYVNMPTTIRGYVVSDPDGDFNIYLNSNLSRDLLKLTIQHELAHIENNDFQKESPADEIEKDLKRA